MWCVLRVAWGVVRLAQPQEPGQRLQGFAQAHVVGQDAAEAVGGQVGEEVKALELVRAQLGGHAGRQVGRHAGLDLAGAALDLLDLLLGQELPGGVIGELQGVQALRLGGKFARVQAQPGEPFVLVVAQVELEPAPAFALEPHVGAFGVEQQLDFLLRQRGVGHVEHHAQVEPVNVRLRDIELHAAGHGAPRRRRPGRRRG